jgi:hypothetical protein
MNATDYLGLGLGLLILASPVLLIVRDWWCMAKRPGYVVNRFTEGDRKSLEIVNEYENWLSLRRHDEVWNTEK